MFFIYGGVLEYKIYTSSGNDTAIVYGVDYSIEDKKNINDFIINKHKNVEQVGFIDKEKKELVMAGGEFCGNATRCAAYDILDGNIGIIKIKINNNLILNAGVDEDNNVWCEIPINNKNLISKISNDIYIIDLNDINFIVMSQNYSKEYLIDKSNIKKTSMSYINKYNLTDKKAVGVIYLEDIGNDIKIHPIVWVKSIDTCFYETACGSGSIAVCIVLSYIKKDSLTIKLIQPSNKIINASIENNDNIFSNAKISGEVKLISNDYI